MHLDVPLLFELDHLLLDLEMQLTRTESFLCQLSPCFLPFAQERNSFIVSADGRLRGCSFPEWR